MAGSGRDERHLMRQRGAGLRAVNNVDFGFNFGTQGSRDDRQLMRQRGAGNRKIDNVNFGFSFPTPSSSRRSSSRASLSARRSTGRISRTPSKHPERESSAARSVQGTSSDSYRLPSGQRGRSLTPQPVVQPEQPNSSKRRRTSKYAEIPDLNATTQSLQSSHQKQKDAPFTIARDDTQVDPTHNKQVSITRIETPLQHHSTRDSSPLFFPDHNDKENNGNSREQIKVQSNGKRRRSGVNNSIRALQTSLVPDVNEPVVPSIEAAEPEPLVGTDDLEHDGDPSTTEGQEIATDDLVFTGDNVDASVKASKKRKKRKSVVLVRKKRRSSEGPRSSVLEVHSDKTLPQQSTNEGHTDKQRTEEHSEPNALENSVERENISEKLPEVALSQRRSSSIKRRAGRRNRLSVSTSPAPRGPEDEEGDETYVDEHVSPEPPTPAPKRKIKPTQRKRRTSQASTSRVSKQDPSGSTVPILTHRMTNLGALPTIVEENEDSDDSEGISRAPTAFSGRAQPNAIDVLAQICRETIESTLAKVESMSGSATSRAEIRRKRTALEAFADGLDQRLFEMSQAVENRTTLESRVRKSKRELAELQARWIGVRRQRDDVALEADAIRRENWDNEEHCKRRWEISELAHRTELELHNETTEEDDVEFLLNSVASNVSSAQGRSGLLDRVKLFNGQLERLAMILERR